MDIQPYIVYVMTNGQNHITDINSSAFLSNTDGWTEIDRGFDNKHHHAQGHYLAKSICDDRGIYRYRLVLGVPQERTQEDMDADYTEQEMQPTQEERIAALEAQLAAYEAAYAEGVNEA